MQESQRVSKSVEFPIWWCFKKDVFFKWWSMEHQVPLPSSNSISDQKWLTSLRNSSDYKHQQLAIDGCAPSHGTTRPFPRSYQWDYRHISSHIHRVVDHIWRAVFLPCYCWFLFVPCGSWFLSSHLQSPVKFQIVNINAAHRCTRSKLQRAI